LDGEDRQRCLMRVAFAMQRLIERDEVVIAAATEHLRLLQRSDVNIDALLLEIAQWYGILIPTENAHWSFVHRTIHDFLAARHWVESGRFVPDEVADWNPRAAYAACLLPDATSAICCSLRRAQDVAVLAECLANHAPFEVDTVASAVIDYFRRVKHAASLERSDVSVRVKTMHNVFSLASEEFLYALMRAAAPGTHIEHDVVMFCSVAEARRRGYVVPGNIVEDLLARFGQDATVDVTADTLRVHTDLRDFVGLS
jgi:hypothetical protein